MSTVRASRRKHHIIYKTTCLATNKWYIGMHSTDNLDDGYSGSGQQLLRSIKKYGKLQHKTEIIEFCTDRINLARREEEIVTQKLLEDKLCMNLMVGGAGKSDRPIVTKESTSRKNSKALDVRWANNIPQRINKHISRFMPLTREQIVNELILPNGQVSINAMRNLKRREIPSRLREAQVALKWNFILDALANENFPNATILELVNAYVNEIDYQPKCKLCTGSVTFFRFGYPYASYCGASCQLKDPANTNPVLKRWNK